MQGHSHVIYEKPIVRPTARILGHDRSRTHRSASCSNGFDLDIQHDSLPSIIADGKILTALPLRIALRLTI